MVSARVLGIPVFAVTMLSLAAAVEVGADERRELLRQRRQIHETRDVNGDDDVRRNPDFPRYRRPPMPVRRNGDERQTVDGGIAGVFELDSVIRRLNLTGEADACFRSLVGILNRGTVFELMSDDVVRTTVAEEQSCMHFARLYSTRTPTDTRRSRVVRIPRAVDGSPWSRVSRLSRAIHHRRGKRILDANEEVVGQHGDDATRLRVKRGSALERRRRRRRGRQQDGRPDKLTQSANKLKAYVNDSLNYSPCGPVCSIGLKDIFTRMLPGCVSEDRKCCTCIVGAVAYQVPQTATPGLPG